MANSVCLDLAVRKIPGGVRVGEGNGNEGVAMAKPLSASPQVTIEGRSDAELPERILAAVRCDHIDFKKCTVTLPSRKRL
eukprot:scaffold13515_cov48-Isochrysis_galbana.AAC.1